MKKILIVEDESIIANELKELLENSGYKAEILMDFEHSLEGILQADADLLLLDINLPYLNGEQLLQQLRLRSEVPVIMLTSKATEIDEVLSMSYGADDYITKPYNPTLLLLRISAILKRSSKGNETLKYHDVTVLQDRGLLKSNEMEVELTKNEMIIFGYLFQNQGKIVARDDLMTALWNHAEFVNENALTVNISRLRSKLAQLGHEHAIKTKKGQGYILV